MNLQSVKNVVLERVLLERNASDGLFIAGPDSSATVSDLVVRDTASDATGNFGNGLTITGGATCALSRVQLVRNRNFGMAVNGAGSVLTVDGALIDDTQRIECVTPQCRERAGGVGALALEGGRLDARTFLFRGNALCGVQIGEGAQVDLFDGEVSANPIGVNIQDDDYDTGRLTNDVLYRDNDSNLDAARLPLPRTTAAVP